MREWINSTDKVVLNSPPRTNWEDFLTFASTLVSTQKISGYSHSRSLLRCLRPCVQQSLDRYLSKQSITLSPKQSEEATRCIVGYILFCADVHLRFLVSSGSWLSPDRQRNYQGMFLKYINISAFNASVYPHARSVLSLAVVKWLRSGTSAGF